MLQSSTRQQITDRVKLHHFNWLMKVQRPAEAKSLVEQAVSQHLEGAHKLAVDIAKEFQAQLWNLGVERFEVCEYGSPTVIDNMWFRSASTY